MAKRLGSLYAAGKRCGAWLKLPLKEVGDFIIGGFRVETNVLVLLVGSFDKDNFKFAGKVCHGLRARQRAEMLRVISQRPARTCPFMDLPNCKNDPFGEMVIAEEMGTFVWLDPEQSVRVAFTEVTRWGALRHAELVALN